MDPTTSVSTDGSTPTARDRLRRRRAPDVGLGRTQIIVLHLLAMDAKSVRTLAYDGFGLTESSARSALDRLGSRSLVDRKFEHDTLVYFLTSEGAEVEKSLDPFDEEED